MTTWDHFDGYMLTRGFVYPKLNMTYDVKISNRVSIYVYGGVGGGVV